LDFVSELGERVLFAMELSERPKDYVGVRVILALTCNVMILLTK